MEKTKKILLMGSTGYIGSNIYDLLKKKTLYTDIQQKNCGDYINELARRRKVDLKFIPSSFKDWCGIRD